MNKEVYYNRALVKKALNDHQGACKDYEKAKKLGLELTDKAICNDQLSIR